MDRIRVKYSKGKEVRYISHLDVIRALERALRRADIPFALTEGFNPKPRMNFSPPLSLGYMSCAEYFDIDVKAYMEAEKFMERMNSVLPTGFTVLDAAVISPDAKSLNSIIDSSEYVVNYPFDGDVPNDIGGFLNNEIIVEKRSKKGIKTVDIKPLIYSLTFADNNTLKLWLASGSSDSINPMYVLKALLGYFGKELREEAVLITRVGQYIDKNKNTPMQAGVSV